ncbi:MAG TPA: helix-turn-helix domain-containing protein, partial [Polyangiaceae bacterium]
MPFKLPVDVPRDQDRSGQKRAAGVLVYAWAGTTAVPSRFNHELVTRARLDLDLTQEQLAHALGVDVRTYRRYESGDVNDPSEGFSLRHASRRRILRRLSQELGIAETELLSDVLPRPSACESPLTWAPRFAHAFPRAPHFVGREDLLAALDTWWQAAAQAPVFALVGVGGSGKTSLAERWLDSLLRSQQSPAIFAYSFYDDERVESFAEQALSYFSRAESLDAPGDALTRLQTLLEQSNHLQLLVLDGLEVVQSTGEDGTGCGRVTDPALRRLLRCAARGLGNTRFLVTTRFELSDLAEWQGSGVQTQRLGALSSAEAKSLLIEWGLQVEPRVLAALVERIGGHALSISMLGSLVGSFLASGPGEKIQRELERSLEPSSLESASRDDPRARRLLAVHAAYAR